MTISKQTVLGFVICVDNSGYLASLQVGKSYKMLPEDNAEPDEIRVIDESGEDYLYPANYFSSEVQPLAESEADPQPYSDITREIRGFIEENESLLEKASHTTLGRIYVHGANIFTTINDEVIEGAKLATATKNALAAAIRNPATPPRRLHELETEEASASEVYAARMAASTELGDFLDRVKALLPEDADEGKEE